MEISNDKKILTELEIALSYYIKGLTITSKNIEWISNIQRITEQAILSYSIMDIRKSNFLEVIKVKSYKNNFKILLSNENCKYANTIMKLTIEIPFIKSTETHFTLGGQAKVNL